jgi:hypothetical protein
MTFLEDFFCCFKQIEMNYRPAAFFSDGKNQKQPMTMLALLFLHLPEKKDKLSE